MKPRFLFIFLLLGPGLVMAQPDAYTEQDSLRGSITAERKWWDLNYYDLEIRVDPEDQFISGKNLIRYKVLETGQILQIDLQPPLRIIRVMQGKVPLEVSSKVNVHYIKLNQPQKVGDYNEITVFYEGHPREALRAPWDGGFSWKEDKEGNPFVATSCQGLGASAWWPNKDHLYDEVDSMAIRVSVPKNLKGVANGRLRAQTENDSLATFHWFVTNPINNYGVNVNIADYVQFGTTYSGEKGKLDLDYHVLPYNLEKAKHQFSQVPLMLEAFEHWFGPYPFYEDSFKLVEVPYLGMEHQSSITYGNEYGNGYLGYDLSGTGWGLKFDFIIIHEGAHEWFANNITYKDIADMWIHEAFAAYAENLYLDYHFGTEAAEAYVIGTRGNIRNDSPIIGVYDVNQRGSGDMYYKGANMLHTLRQLVGDDEKWRNTLRGLNEAFYHQTVKSAQIEAYLSEATGLELSSFFDQYLRTIEIPLLEYEVHEEQIRYRYSRVVPGFDMPVRFWAGEKHIWLKPGAAWKTEKNPGGTAWKADPNFYIETVQL